MEVDMYKMFLSFIFLASLVSGCGVSTGSSPTAVTSSVPVTSLAMGEPSPTATEITPLSTRLSTPLPTITPTPAPLPSATPTPTLVPYPAFMENNLLGAPAEGAYLRLGRGIMTALATSPDGRILAAARLRGVYLYDKDTGRTVGYLDHGALVNTLDFSPDGRWLATGGRSPQVVIWDVQTGKRVGTVEAPPGNQYISVYSVRFSPDSRYLAVAGYPLDIVLWDVGQQEIAWQHDSQAVQTIRTVAFSPDGKTFVWGVTRPEGQVSFVNLDGEITLVSALSMPDGVNSLLFLGADELLIALEDGSLRRWNLATMSETDYWPWVDAFDAHTMFVTGVFNIYVPLLNQGALSPDRRWVLESSGIGSVYLRSVDTGAVERTFLREDVDFYIDARAAVFSPDGKQVIAGWLDGSIAIWDREDGSEIAFFEGNGWPVVEMSPAPVPDVVYALQRDHRVVRWDTTTGEAQVARTLAQGSHMAVSPAGDWLAVTEPVHYVVSMFQLPDLKQTAMIEVYDDLADVVFSPDGQTLITGGWSGQPVAWAPTGEQLFLYEKVDAGLNDLAYAPSGEYLAASLDNGLVALWNAKEGNLVSFLEKPADDTFRYNHALTFSLDSRYLAAAGVGETHYILLWDVESQKILVDIPTNEFNPLTMCFSEDGRLLYTGGEMNYGDPEASIQVWDLKASALVGEIKGPLHSVTSLAWTPGGDSLIAAGEDGTLLFWDAKQLNFEPFSFDDLYPVPMPPTVRYTGYDPDGDYYFYNAGFSRAEEMVEWLQEELPGLGFEIVEIEFRPNDPRTFEVKVKDTEGQGYVILIQEFTFPPHFVSVHPVDLP